MASNEFDLREFLDFPLRTDAQVDILGDKEAKLI
jgi:hypothetical protein